MTGGKVSLVGAGPGRADLITVRGLTLLRQAEVVLYDRLIAIELLAEVPEGAQKIYVGKAPDHHALSQGKINRLLVDHAQRGNRVVRLKGGDPFVFGRGGEEALALVEAGIPFEIVPGVTSAVAVPLYAGIPVTQRGIAAGFAVVTGHEAQEKDAGELDWSALARIPTLVILMGVANIGDICAGLMGIGRDPQTPAAAISQGTTKNQRVIRTSLERLTEAIQQSDLQAPAVIVIGEVAQLADDLAWFDPASDTEGTPNI